MVFVSILEASFFEWLIAENRVYENGHERNSSSCMITSFAPFAYDK